jgi:carbon-monoxide dehydrogenase medium subunit
MYSFTYNRASGLRQAQNMLGKLDEPKLLAGGQSLLPAMKLRLASHANLVDLCRVEGLAGIELKGRSLVIGAMTRHADVASSAVVQQAIPALAHLAGEIGDPAVRHMGTLGGSIANNDPNADYPAGVLGLGATIVTTKRRIKSDDFFKGLFETALTARDVLTAIRIPAADADTRVGFAEFARRHGDYAMVGLAACARADGQRLRDLRLAYFGVGSTPVRAHHAEQALTDRDIDAAVHALAQDLNPPDDVQASGAVKTHLAGVLLRRVARQLDQVPS